MPAIGIPLCLCCWKLVPSKGAALQIKTTFAPPIGCFLTFILSIINWDNYVLTQPSINANTVTHIYSCMKNQQTRLLGAQLLKVPIFMPNRFEKLIQWLIYKYYVLVNIAIKDSWNGVSKCKCKEYNWLKVFRYFLVLLFTHYFQSATQIAAEQDSYLYFSIIFEREGSDFWLMLRSPKFDYLVKLGVKISHL